MTLTKNTILEFLTNEIYKLTKENNIDANVTLDNYGFESITYTELINSINDAFNTDLIPTLFFELESPTLSNAVEYIYNTIDNTEDIIQNNEQITPVKDNDEFDVHDTFMEDSNSSFSPILEYEDDEYKHRSSEEIAIIGIDGKFPQSDSLEIFWDNILKHKNFITEIPTNRFDYRIYNDPYIKWGGFMNNIDKFDAPFFNISDEEAKFLDPQHRLFLQSSLRTIGDAGYTLSKINGKKMGVFVGIGSQDYSELIKNNIDVTNPPPYALTGVTSFMLANRISSFLNVRGPSEPVDTACSSSLVAINRAINSMLNNECDMALVGGVNIITTPSIYHSFSSAGMLNNSPECRVFDEEANGTIRSEGVGSILLKPIKKALEDRDNIHAIIKKSVVNHKGKTSSLTAINKDSIIDLLSEAYSDLNIRLEDIDYIESHSTGSKLGDSIEIQAIQSCLPINNNSQKVFMGSLKSSLGHMEAASGIGSLLKVILSIQNKTLIGLDYFKNLNSYIKLSDTPLLFTKNNKVWEKRGENIPRRAAINTFGFGGVNAHLVIEEFLKNEHKSEEHKNIFVLSGTSEESLNRKSEKIMRYIHDKNYKDSDINNICFTLQQGREHLPYRLAFVVENINDILTNLKHYINKDYNSKVISVSNLEDQSNQNISEILDEPELNEIIKKWINQKKLSKIQKLWINGLVIPWNQFYINKNVHKVSLPSFDFNEYSYWISEKKVHQSKNTVLNEHHNLNLNNINSNYDVMKNTKQEILELIKNYIPSNSSFDEYSSFKEYGIDSIILIQIVKKLQTRNITIKFEDIYNSNNLNDLFTKINTLTDYSKRYEYPELVKLNNVTKGKPIFWIHGGFGGVEVYRFIAQHINRPFYGIQSPGYMNNKKPLKSVEQLANYYYKIITSIQPEDEYDIGGLSFGGTIAYELSRILQKEKRKVQTLLMLESIYVEEDMRKDWKSINSKDIQKDRIFRIANLLLAFNNSNSKEFIHSNEVSLSNDFNRFFEDILNLSINKGMNKNKNQLRKTLNNLNKVLTCLDEASTFYIPQRLTDKIETAIYISNNKNTVFGDEEDYFRLVDKGRNYDFSKSFEKWKTLIPNLERKNTVSSSHLTIITEENSLSKIINICKEIYK